jgi:hypothetical protein
MREIGDTEPAGAEHATQEISLLDDGAACEVAAIVTFVVFGIIPTA